jgi:tetratricopeptide (TPR) repeat protein
MRWLGVHPAATAEILSGALISAGKFEQAEQTYGLIRNVRQSAYGYDSESTVGLIADYGDLYFLQKRYVDAQNCYTRSIELSRKIHGVTGYGRPLTGLANCLREKREWTKAEALYQEALGMRTRLYGVNSDKVAATLKEYALLLDQSGRKQESLVLLSRALSIDGLRKKDDSNPLPTLLVMGGVFVISLLLFGRRGFLTKIATVRLQNKIKQASVPQAADLKRLEVLSRYQGMPVAEGQATESVIASKH